jgi:hypothetical protein
VLRGYQAEKMALEREFQCTTSQGKVSADMEQQGMARIPLSAPVPLKHHL